MSLVSRISEINRLGNCTKEVTANDSLKDKNKTDAVFVNNGNGHSTTDDLCYGSRKTNSKNEKSKKHRGKEKQEIINIDETEEHEKEKDIRHRQ